MANRNIYEDIAARTGGDICIGVVGPVRTGKSTFIKRFMEEMVIPNIPDKQMRQRANDELPQSSAGKMIITTEPKFIPEDAVEISVSGKLSAEYSVPVIPADCLNTDDLSASEYIDFAFVSDIEFFRHLPASACERGAS